MTKPDTRVKITKNNVDEGNIPPPASLLAKEIQVVRRLDDAAQ